MSRGAGEQGCGGAKALERYLNSACTGLFGLERQTVRGELEANLLERVREFQVMGCSSDVALEKALEEFGAPSRVSRGMREVYLLPNVMKGGAIAGFLAMSTYLALASSVAGSVPISLCGGDQAVFGTTTGVLSKATPKMLKQGCPAIMAFLKLEDIRADFARQGFQLTANGKRFTLEGSGKRLLDLVWANPQEAISSHDKQPYVNLSSLLTFDNDTQVVNVPVTFDRLLSPTVNLGGAKLQPITQFGGSPVDITMPVAWRIAFFMHQAIDPKFQEFGYGNSVRFGERMALSDGKPLQAAVPIPDGVSLQMIREASFSPVRQQTQTLKYLGTPGKVYALAWIRKDPNMKRNPAKYLMNEFVETALATADARGTLKFETDVSRSEFTNSLETFKQARGKKALLLELTGRLDNAAPAFVVVKNPPPSSQSR